MGHDLLWIAAAADLTLALAHGVIGQRKMVAPLTADRLFAAPRVHGDADQVRRIFALTWHLATVVFLASAIAFALLALGRIEGIALARFLAATHLAFVVVALLFVGRRIPASLRLPIPVVALTCMTSVAVVGWVG